MVTALNFDCLTLWELQVDRGFVAQIADIGGGRRASMDKRQEAVAFLTVPPEFSTVPHTRGILSMARHSDPNRYAPFFLNICS